MFTRSSIDHHALRGGLLAARTACAAPGFRSRNGSGHGIRRSATLLLSLAALLFAAAGIRTAAARDACTRGSETEPVEVSDGTELQNLLSPRNSGCNTDAEHPYTVFVKLDGDILNTTLRIGPFSVAYIDLAGHKIDLGPENVDSVIYVQGTLTLSDSVGNGTVTGGYSSLGAGVSVNGGTFNMEGGTISGNTSEDYGGGVSVAHGTFNLDGGTVTGNKGQHGGGVYVGTDGIFNMISGTVSSNLMDGSEKIRKGGGVYVENGTFNMEGGTISGNYGYYGSGGGVYVDIEGTFAMSGGEIKGNSADQDGGGVYVDFEGTFAMSGGEIKGNSAGQEGGGVYVIDSGAFKLSGGKISGNMKNGSMDDDGTILCIRTCLPSNIYLYSLAKITVTGPLDTAEGKIGISMHIPGVFTSGLKGSGDATGFTSEMEDYYEIRLNSLGEAVLARSAVSTPVISPDPGPCTEAQTVTITCDTKYASIFYTTDGTGPTAESTEYTRTFTVSETTTVKAIAVLDGYFDSETASAAYTFVAPELSVTAPSFEEADYGYSRPDAKGITIANTGDAAAAVTSVGLGGVTVTKDAGTASNDAFELNKTGESAIAAGSIDSTTYTVQPKEGLDAGTYETPITVSYNGRTASDTVTFKVNRAADPAVISETAEVTAGGNTVELSGNVSGAQGTVTYAITGETHGCSVDGTTGRLTSGNETGEVTVTVTIEDSQNHTGKTGTITVTVTDKPEPEPEPDHHDRIKFFRLCEDCELPATGFSGVRLTALSEQPKELRYEPVRMRLMLPTLDQDLELVTVPRQENSWAVDWLGADAGILAGSAVPGEGTAVIAAHNTLNDTQYGPFAMLASMEPGDRVFVTDEKGELLFFEVYANELLAPNDMAVIESLAEENALVLITCENEAVGGGYLNRRAVFAK